MSRWEGGWVGGGGRGVVHVDVTSRWGSALTGEHHQVLIGQALGALTEVVDLHGESARQVSKLDLGVAG